MVTEAKDKDSDLKTDIAKLDNPTLSNLLIGWNIRERIFVREYRDGECVREEAGWIADSPNNNYALQIEKDAKRVRVLHQGEELAVSGLTVVSRDLANTHLSFKGEDTDLSIRFSQPPSTDVEALLKLNTKSGHSVSLRWKLN